MTSAASDTSRMNGNMMRVSRPSSAPSRRRSPGRAKPRADARTPCRARRAPRAPASERGHLVREAPRRRVSFARDRLAEGGDERGGQRSLGEQVSQQIGNRNAAVKSSIAAAPNSAAQICSRARPSTRLHMTASPMTPAARVQLLGAVVRGIGGDTWSGRGGLVLDLILTVWVGLAASVTRPGVPAGLVDDRRPGRVSVCDGGRAR